jgi:coproporphyrinogen III oxidase-like Fe-S oxidoreductase
MKSNFIQSSKNLLLDFLYTPGGFSFFPSPIFWASNFKYSDLSNSLKHLPSFNSQERKTTTLYIHIPFCDKICNYCNCFKKKLLLSEEIDRYIEYLEQEARIYYNII